MSRRNNWLSDHPRKIRTVPKWLLVILAQSRFWKDDRGVDPESVPIAALEVDLGDMTVTQVAMIEGEAIREVETEVEDIDDRRVAIVEVEDEAVRMIRMMPRIHTDHTTHMGPIAIVRRGSRRRSHRRSRRRSHRRSRRRSHRRSQRRSNLMPFEMFVKMEKCWFLPFSKKDGRESRRKDKSSTKQDRGVKSCRMSDSLILLRIGMSFTKSLQLQSRRFSLSTRILGIADLRPLFKVTSWSL